MRGDGIPSTSGQPTAAGRRPDRKHHLCRAMDPAVSGRSPHGRAGSNGNGGNSERAMSTSYSFPEFQLALYYSSLIALTTNCSCRAGGNGGSGNPERERLLSRGGDGRPCRQTLRAHRAGCVPIFYLSFFPVRLFSLFELVEQVVCPSSLIMSPITSSSSRLRAHLSSLFMSCINET